MRKEESVWGNRRVVIITLTLCGLILYTVPHDAQTFISAMKNAGIGTFLCFGSGLYAYFYLRNYAKKPAIYCKSGTPLDSLISQYIPTLSKRYMPVYWAAESRCITILRSMTPCLGSVKYRREIVREPGGGQFYLDWCDNNEENSRFPDSRTRPTVLILPGVTSTSSSRYIGSITQRLVERGYRVMVLIYRGLEGMEVLTPRTYSGTCPSDVEIAVNKFRQTYPEAKLFAIGASLGTLILGSYLKDKRWDSKVDAAMFFSCPFNAPVCAAEVETWANFLLINFHVAKQQKRIYRRNSQVFESIVDHEKIMKASHIREFDQHFTAPIFGYKTAEEYYEDCILDQDKLNAIKTPLLCVGSNDDCFSPEHGLPKEEITNTDHVALVMTYGGGHVSHLQGLNPFGKTYFEEIMTEYLDSFLLHEHKLKLLR